MAKRLLSEQQFQQACIRQFKRTVRRALHCRTWTGKQLAVVHDLQQFVDCDDLRQQVQEFMVMARGYERLAEEIYATANASSRRVMDHDLHKLLAPYANLDSARVPELERYERVADLIIASGANASGQGEQT